jgi:membrane protein required for colicin V production
LISVVSGLDQVHYTEVRVGGRAPSRKLPDDRRRSASSSPGRIDRTFPAMNILDIIVIVVIALSALIAFARGFVKEALSILSWVGAAAATVYGLQYVRPYADKLISSPMVAGAVASVGLFIVSLIVISLLTSALAGQVKRSSLSALDRSLGFVFGAARGIVIACLGILVISWAIPEPDWPGWMRESKTRPYLANGADYLKSLVPAQTRTRGAEAAAEAQRNYEQMQEAQKLMQPFLNPKGASGNRAAPPAPAYKPSERREMDRVFQGAQ